MQKLIRIEELAMFLLALAGLTINDCGWWWFLLLLVGPDISMLGYLAGNKFGAFLYNLFHHKGTAISVLLISYLMGNITGISIGIVLFGHSSMDRFFGFGLKTKEGFKFTHLGTLSKKE